MNPDARFRRASVLWIVPLEVPDPKENPSRAVYRESSILSCIPAKSHWVTCCLVKASVFISDNNSQQQLNSSSLIFSIRSPSSWKLRRRPVASEMTARNKGVRPSTRNRILGPAFRCLSRKTNNSNWIKVNKRTLWLPHMWRLKGSRCRARSPVLGKAELLAPADWICKSMCTDVTDALFCRWCSFAPSVWQAVLAVLLH